jgi:hypothetical protein
MAEPFSNRKLLVSFKTPVFNDGRFVGLVSNLGTQELRPDTLPAERIARETARDATPETPLATAESKVTEIDVVTQLKPVPGEEKPRVCIETLVFDKAGHFIELVSVPDRGLPLLLPSLKPTTIRVVHDIEFSHDMKTLHVVIMTLYFNEGGRLVGRSREPHSIEDYPIG